MSALRNVEDTIGGFVERVFGRMFRGHVEPVELARKLAREMEDHKTVSVTRVYVPNEYVVYLSASDRNRFASFEGALTTELGVYVGERARHEGFTLLSTPVVRLETDTDLRVGEYGIACRVVDPPAEAPAEVDAATPDPQPELTRFTPASAPEATAIAVVPEVPSTDGALDDAADVDDGAADAARAEDDGFVAEREPEAGSDAPPIDAAPAAVVPDASPEPVAALEPPEPEAEVAPEPEAPIAEIAVPEPPSPPVPVIVPEPTPAPEPVAVAPPAPAPPTPAPDPEPMFVPPAVPAAEVVPDPEPPAPTPLPPPGGYEPLAGVSGTQILSAAEARAEGLLQEELALMIAGRRYPVTQRTTTIGRSRDCDIVLSDANASRRHAEIRHIGLDYFAVDLGSTNGTIVNGQRVRRHALAHGDRILIGTTELVVEHNA